MTCNKISYVIALISLFVPSMVQAAGGLEAMDQLASNPRLVAWFERMQERASEFQADRQRANVEAARQAQIAHQNRQNELNRLARGGPGISEFQRDQARRQLGVEQDQHNAEMNQAASDRRRWQDLEFEGVRQFQNTVFGELRAGLEHGRKYEISLGESKVKASENRKMWIEQSKLWISTIKKNPVGIIGLTLGTSLAVSGGYYGAKHGIGTAFEMYKKPVLADEDKTSMKFGIWNAIKGWIYGEPVVESSLSDVILKPELAERINETVSALQNTVKNGGYLKNIMLWGQPGTGKTMLAMRMARSCGLDFIYFTASNLEPFSIEEASNQLIQLFRYAQNAENAVMIIIDEAEGLLGSRANPNVTDKKKTLLNLILGYTGTETRGYMITILTNRPEDIDEAFLSRCDERIQISAPESIQRHSILEHYVDKFLKKAENLVPKKLSIFSRKYWFGKEEKVTPPSIAPDALTEEFLDEISDRIKGFVGRDISKMVIQIQNSALATEDNRITKDLVNRVVNTKIQELQDQSKGFIRDEVNLAASAA